MKQICNVLENKLLILNGYFNHLRNNSYFEVGGAFYEKLLSANRLSLTNLEPPISIKQSSFTIRI